MPSIDVEDVQASQLRPFGPPGSATQVLVTFSVSGVAREFVEVYVTTDIGAFDASLVGRVPINFHSNEYSIALSLIAGMVFEIRCCPRTTTNGIPDKIMDDEPWENSCSAIRFATEADPLPERPSKPRPEIVDVISHHATLHQKNRITLRWRSVRRYEWYQIRFKSDEFVQAGETQVDLNLNSSSGEFTLEPTKPGRRYLFKVNGCDENDFGAMICSGFTEPVFAHAASNTHSLRAFLDVTDATSGVRHLLQPSVNSIKALMGLIG